VALEEGPSFSQENRPSPRARVSSAHLIITTMLLNFWTIVMTLVTARVDEVWAFSTTTTTLRRQRRRRVEARGLLSDLPPEGVSAAIAGGTVGVLGSIVAIEYKKRAVQKSKDCPYCSGRGSLTCAGCLGTGMVGDVPCPVCLGVKAIACENCKGRGRFIPTMLDSRASRDPETAAEDIGLL